MGHASRNEMLEPEEGSARLADIRKRLLVSPPRKPDIGPVPTNSGLLNRIDAFFEEAKGRGGSAGGEDVGGGEKASKVELEDDYVGEHVELDLACGLFDLIDDEAVRAAEAACGGLGTDEGAAEPKETRLVEEVPARDKGLGCAKSD